jgi:hypothetical protein
MTPAPSLSVHTFLPQVSQDKNPCPAAAITGRSASALKARTKIQPVHAATSQAQQIQSILSAFPVMGHLIVVTTSPLQAAKTIHRRHHCDEGDKTDLGPDRHFREHAGLLVGEQDYL